jgi:hypothetical protein
MSVQNPYGMHYQSVWEERSANPLLPNWIRVAALAFGCHRANGHANFKPGELGELLGKPAPGGGWARITPQAVSNAIKLAKNAGWIAEDSTARCLVVPHHAVSGGLGNANEKCPVHAGRRTGVDKPRVHVEREQSEQKFTFGMKPIHVERELATR